MHAERPRLVARGSDDPSAIRLAADGERLSAKRRIVALLDRRVERVHVNVQNPSQHTKPATAARVPSRDPRERLILRTRPIPLKRVADRVGERAERKTSRDRLVVTRLEDAVCRSRNPQRQFTPGCDSLIEQELRRPSRPDARYCRSPRWQVSSISPIVNPSSAPLALKMPV